MQYRLKNIDELKVADLKTVMLPTAAVRLIQGQSEFGTSPNIVNINYFNIGTNKNPESHNQTDQLSRNIETGKVVIVQSNPVDNDSVLSSVGRLTTNIPEALRLKIKELFVIVRASSVNRTIPYELISKKAAISSLVAQQQVQAQNSASSSSSSNTANSNGSSQTTSNTPSTRRTNPYAAQTQPVLYYEINVELAGQWPRNSASLFLEKTNQQDKAIARPRADRNLAHRSLSRFRNIDNEPRNLYLNIPDKNGSAPLQLLLAENIAPVEKDTEMDEWDNVLVPVRPLAYLDESKSKANAAELKGGYLYLFWKGELWRELKVTERSYYQDVNLEKYRSQSVTQSSSNNELRPAEGSPLPDLWIPYKLDGQVQTGATGVKLLFWPTQLTDDQINNYEATPADLDIYATELDGLSAYSQSQAFSDDQHVSDMLSNSLIPVTDNDMPWLGNATSLFGRLQNANIATAYLDGQNRGIQVLLDVGLEMDDDTKVPTLLALLTHDDSDWEQVITLNTRQDSEWSNWRTASFNALPESGAFSLYLINPDSNNDFEEVFRAVTYKDLTDLKPQEVKNEDIQSSDDDLDDIITDDMKQEFSKLISSWDL
ncbi:hypothetical protein [Moritella sp. 28]|uniref:hypothetical protein n=1 Tax=Moritella sp. 28 TaxID=2746232 RepID=UPI001BABD6A0|nr:hypothetical protein [Moritella sp. 28]QUM85206.1 hypothetical protein HWV02_12205 [Moritella sp. 28]